MDCFMGIECSSDVSYFLWKPYCYCFGKSCIEKKIKLSQILLFKCSQNIFCKETVTVSDDFGLNNPVN